MLVQLSQSDSSSANSLPEITVKIVEAFILPSFGKAICFVHFSLHNASALTVEIPYTDNYCLVLTLKTEERVSADLINDWFDYRLHSFNWVEEYDDDGERHDVKRDRGLPDLLTRPGVTLNRGRQVTGWLGFEFRGMPAWPIREEEIGQRQESVFDDDGEHIGWKWEPEFERTLLSTNVEKITLQVIDPFGVTHTASKTPPFHLHGREIRKEPKAL